MTFAARTLGSSGVAFTAFTQTVNFSGGSTQLSTSVTIPTGATNAVIEIWGSGASGAASNVGSNGGGGGAGGYSRSASINVSAGNGQTIACLIGGNFLNNTGYATSVSTGTFSLTTQTANGGGIGGILTGGTGGTASGGSVNTSGGNGAANITGGTAVTGVNGGPAGVGGNGANASLSNQTAGGAGLIVIRWT